MPLRHPAGGQVHPASASVIFSLERAFLRLRLVAAISKTTTTCFCDCIQSNQYENQHLTQDCLVHRNPRPSPTPSRPLPSPHRSHRLRNKNCTLPWHTSPVSESTDSKSRNVARSPANHSTSVRCRPPSWPTLPCSARQLQVSRALEFTSTATPDVEPCPHQTRWHTPRPAVEPTVDVEVVRATRPLQ